MGQALASAIKRGIARTTDVPDATAFDAANAFNRAKPALPTSVVVDGRLIDIKAVVSRTKVIRKKKKEKKKRKLLKISNIKRTFPLCV